MNDECKDGSIETVRGKQGKRFVRTGDGRITWRDEIGYLEGSEYSEKEGYQIQAVNNRGYRLKEESDVLSEEGIRLCLHKPYDSQKIKVLSALIHEYGSKEVCTEW